MRERRRRDSQHPDSAARSAESRTPPVKKLIIFDLDAALAESKASLDIEIAALIPKLLRDHG